MHLKCSLVFAPKNSNIYKLILSYQNFNRLIYKDNGMFWAVKF